MAMKARPIILMLALCSLVVLLHSRSFAQLPYADDSSAAAHKHTVTLGQRGPVDAFAFNYYVNGLLLQQLGEPYAAIDAFKNAQKTAPESFEISYSLAELYYYLRDPKLALNELNRTGEKNADYYRMAGPCHQSLGQGPEAISAYVHLAELEPDNELAFSYLANAYRQRQDLDSTLWAYDRLAQLSRNNYRVFNEIGRMRAQKGEYDKAKTAFSSSVALESSRDNILAFAGLAELYMITKQPDSAEMVLKAALECDSASPLINRQLTSLYIGRDSLATALPFARKVVELAPLDRGNVRRLGILYLTMDSLAKADSIFSDLVSQGDHSEINDYYLGRVAFAAHQYERAREYFASVLQYQDADTVADHWLDLGATLRMLNKPDSEVIIYRTGLERVHDSDGVTRLMFGMGSAFERSGQFDSAVETLSKVVARKLDDAQACNYLGYMLADKNVRLEYARDLIERSVKADSNNAAFLDSYGWVYFRLGKLDKALKYLKKAASLTKDATIYDHLGDVCSADGKAADARQWWQKALELDPENAAVKAKLAK